MYRCSHRFLHASHLIFSSHLSLHLHKPITCHAIHYSPSLSSAHSLSTGSHADTTWNLRMSRAASDSSRRNSSSASTSNAKRSRPPQSKERFADKTYRDRPGGGGGNWNKNGSTPRGDQRSRVRNDERQQRWEKPDKVTLDEENDWEWDGGSLPGVTSSTGRQRAGGSNNRDRGGDSYGRNRARSGQRFEDDSDEVGGEGEEWEERDWRRDGKPGTGNPRNDLVGEVLYGVSPVLNALRFKRRALYTLYQQQSMDMSKRKDAKAAQTILTLAQEAGLEVKQMDKHHLNLLADNRPHQGFVLDVAPMKWETMDVFPAASDFTSKGECPVWLALDEVVDPQNLGAVIRSAYCLGASGVLACSKNCAPLSAVVSKASSGVLEAMPVHSCKVLMRTLHDAATKGWEVLGTSLDRNASKLHELQVDKPTILVMGNEGHGLRTNVKRACTGMVRIDPGLAKVSTQVVDSLNVSVATGIILHHLVLQAGSGKGAEAVQQPAAAEVGEVTTV